MYVELMFSEAPRFPGSVDEKAEERVLLSTLPSEALLLDGVPVCVLRLLPGYTTIFLLGRLRLCRKPYSSGRGVSRVYKASLQFPEYVLAAYLPLFEPASATGTQERVRVFRSVLQTAKISRIRCHWRMLHLDDVATEGCTIDISGLTFCLHQACMRRFVGVSSVRF